MPIKTTSLLLGLFALSAATAFSAPETPISILLIGQTNQTGIRDTVVTGSASAIVKSSGDDLRISADEIAYDSANGTLKCTGHVTVRSAGRTITGRDLIIELGTAVKGGNVYVLNPNGIVVGASPEKQSDFERWAAKNLAEPLPTFDSRPALLPRQR